MKIVELYELDLNELQIEQINGLLKQLDPTVSPTSKDDLYGMTRCWGCRCSILIDPDKNILGMGFLVVVFTPSGKKSVIEDVVVDESLRGQGFGKLITQTLIEKAESSGCISIFLTSRPDRLAANKLYQSMGFEKRDTNCYRLKLS